MRKPNQVGVRLAAALMLAFAGSAAWPMADVIDRPSMPTARAGQVLFLAVTRAGHRLVAAGERGIVLLSDDDGRAWRQARVPVSVTLTSVHFLDEKNGWIGGHSGVLLHTTDGGETWSRTLDGNDVAKIVLEGEIAKGKAADPAQLQDAKRLVAEGPDKPLLDVLFLSPELGFVAGAYGLFLRTEDGGRTWQPWQSRLPDLKGRHLTRIASVRGDLYVVGEQGAAYLSIDAGRTFRQLESPYRGTFFGVVALSDDDVAIFGLRGKVFRVGRRGALWTTLATPAPVTYCASARRASGETIIASQMGDLLLGAGADAQLAPVAAPGHAMTAAMVEAADGTLIVAGRGVSRLSLGGATGGAR